MSLEDDEPVYSAIPICSSSDKVNPDEHNIVSKPTTSRGKRRAPGAKVVHPDSFKADAPKSTRKVKQATEKSKQQIIPEQIMVEAPTYSGANSSSLSDDVGESAPSSDIPLLEQMISPVFAYDSLDPNSFIEIDYSVWCKADKNFQDICIHINPEGYMLVGNTARYNLRKQQLKAFAQYIMILNYNKKEPIILGVNESLLGKRGDSEFLNAYVIENTCDTNGSKHVQMIIVTTEQQYAKILFEKFLLSDQVGFRNLKNRDMWVSPDDPKLIK